MTSHSDGDVFYVVDLDDSFDQLVFDFARQVNKAISLKSKGKSVNPLRIYINTEGGDMNRAWALIELMDYAVGNKVEVETVVLHSALSAGSAIAVAGSKGKRYCGQNAEYMLHYGESETVVTNPKSAASLSTNQINHFNNLVTHYAHNSRGTLTLEEVYELMDHEHYMDAVQAYEKGFVDGYF